MRFKLHEVMFGPIEDSEQGQKATALPFLVPLCYCSWHPRQSSSGSVLSEEYELSSLTVTDNTIYQTDV